MITEDYVSFETAKLLKEKGFDEYGMYFYTLKDEGREGYKSHKILQEFAHNSEPAIKKRAVSCPTLQMAMKWLRKKHNIHIILDIHWLYFANTLGWMYTITKILENGVDYIDSKGDENDKTFYSSYEEACEAAIKYCLENLI